MENKLSVKRVLELEDAFLKVYNLPASDHRNFTSNKELTKFFETLIKRKSEIEKLIAHIHKLQDTDSLYIVDKHFPDIKDFGLFDINGISSTLISLLNVRLSEIKKEIYAELYPENINVTDHP